MKLTAGQQATAYLIGKALAQDSGTFTVGHASSFDEATLSWMLEGSTHVMVAMRNADVSKIMLREGFSCCAQRVVNPHGLLQSFADAGVPMTKKLRKLLKKSQPKALLGADTEFWERREALAEFMLYMATWIEWNRAEKSLRNNYRKDAHAVILANPHLLTLPERERLAHVLPQLAV